MRIRLVWAFGFGLVACEVQQSAPARQLSVTEAVLTVHPDGPVVRMSQAVVEDGTAHTTEVVVHDAEGALRITAPRSDWDLNAKQARFDGGVEAIRGPVRLTCKELTVHYAGPDRVERAVAVGDVVVVRDSLRATGNRAELTTATGQVELTGEPTLADGPNRLVGERIVLWLDDERVECETCRFTLDGTAVRPQ